MRLKMRVELRDFTIVRLTVAAATRAAEAGTVAQPNAIFGWFVIAEPNAFLSSTRADDQWVSGKR